MDRNKIVRAEVIAIGSELLLGQVVDTNSSHVGGELARAGIHLSQTSAVGDDLDRIIDASGPHCLVLTSSSPQADWALLKMILPERPLASYWVKNRKSMRICGKNCRTCSTAILRKYHKAI